MESLRLIPERPHADAFIVENDAIQCGINNVFTPDFTSLFIFSIIRETYKTNLAQCDHKPGAKKSKQ